MLRLPLLTLTALTWIATAACAADTEGPIAEVEEGRYVGDEIESAPLPTEALLRARATANDLTQDLGGLVMSTLQSEGPVAALEICSGVAQERTATHASAGIAVRRVSDRLRNPLNAPDAAEALELDRMAELQSEGRLPTEIVRLVRQGDQRALHYMRPIVVGPACLTCHGREETIDPQVRQIIDDRYPQDAAVGYEAGDLRGAVSVRVAIAPD